jgi:hypothetical protein
VQDRLFGIPLAGGGGSAVPQLSPGGDVAKLDFTYQPTAKDLSSVVWSRSSSDVQMKQVPGDPLQSWPLLNVAPVPSMEPPISVWPALDGTRVLVHTLGSTYLLEESADGLMEWITVSRTHGIKNPTTLRNTDYGTVWTDQRNQIVCLPPNSLQIQILSQPYQSLMTTDPKCADHLLSPKHDIDRYEVFLADGTSVCHDFTLPAMPAPNADQVLTVPGQAYSSTNRSYTAACSAVDGLGNTHHLVANTALYTQETQPDDGTIPTTDQNGDASLTQISGEYDRNWDDFGDCNVREELPQLSVVGDGAPSTALAGASPLSVEWYGDFEQVTAGNKKTVTLTKSPQSTTDSCYSGKPTNASRFWYKFVLKLTGHSTDDASFATHANPGVQGDLAKNFYGSILRFMRHIGSRENRV